MNNEGKTFPVEKIVMKTALNTITLYYSILRVLEITVLGICFSIIVNGSMSQERGFTAYEGNYVTGMFARNKKMHSARFITKSTNYYFSIEPITGWLLRPIFRLILTGYIYSKYMYDGIEHFYYAQEVIRAMYCWI